MMIPVLLALMMLFVYVSIGYYVFRKNRESWLRQRFFIVSLEMALFALLSAAGMDQSWNESSLALLELSYILLIIMSGYFVYKKRHLLREPLFWLFVAVPLIVLGAVVYGGETIYLERIHFLLVIPYGAFLWVLEGSFRVVQMNDAMYASMLDLVLLLDEKGHIQKTNHRFHTLLGYEASMLADTYVTDIFPSITIEGLRENAIRNTPVIVGLHTTAGKEIPFQLMITKFRCGLGDECLLVVARDMRLIQELESVVETLKDEHEKSQQSDDLFRVMVEMLPHAIVMTRIEDDIVMYANTQAARLFQTTVTAMVGMHAFEFYKDKQNRMDLKRDLLMLNNASIKREYEFRRMDGSVFIGEFTVQKVRYDNVDVLLLAISDVSLQRYLQDAAMKSERLLRSFMDAIPDYIVVSDAEGNITYTNMVSKEMLERNEFVPSSFFDLNWENRDEIIQQWNDCLNKEHQFEAHRVLDANTHQTLNIKANVLRDSDDSVFSIVFVMRDVTLRRKTEAALHKSKEEIEYINTKLLEANRVLTQKTIRDSLTDLFNLKHMNALLVREIHARKNDLEAEALSVMMLDIDHFKEVNDTYGHVYGDDVLKRVATIIQSCLRPSDFPGRYGGEEFIVILPNVSLKQAYAIAQRIRAAVSVAKFDGMEKGITISIGVTTYQTGDDARDLTKRVDQLMYRAKHNGRNRVEMG